MRVVGVPAAFWDFDADARVELKAYETAVNEHLAGALGVKAGDEIALRITRPSLLSRDAPLSSRAEDASVRARCTVRAVLPDTGIGRFGLSAEQAAPYNAFVDLGWLQEQTGLGGAPISSLWATARAKRRWTTALRTCWQPEHIGIEIRSFPDGVLQLQSNHIFLPRGPSAKPRWRCRARKGPSPTWSIRSRKAAARRPTPSPWPVRSRPI